jgi:excinuclease ABC subunit A
MTTAKKAPAKKAAAQVQDMIRIKGARTHNLKNISVEMPRGKMVAVTGLSGSGKSSLAFDTIFAEGQRRYVESLSAYARQFLNQMPKPDVDEITGLSPAISIDQKSRSNNPRSTVATITEMYDYMRVLYARVGKPFCPECGRAIERLSPEEIQKFVLDRVTEFEAQSLGKKSVMGVSWSQLEVRVLAPIVRGRKGEYYQLLYDLLSKGFGTVRVDGEWKKLREKIDLEKNDRHDIDAVVDTLALHEFRDAPKDARSRLSEAVERAMLEAEGLVRISFVDPESGNTIEESVLSSKFACPHDGYSFPEIEPRLFSFNSPYGACPDCNGLGVPYIGSPDVCASCDGTRLRIEARNVFLVPATADAPRLNIVQLTSLSITDAAEFFVDLKLTANEKAIAKPVLREIEDRLQFLLNVGLSYLTLNRTANTLSGGEAQRIRLASQLGSRLVGALYVLDEPTIGLHQRDNEKLIKTLEDLRDLGNTIIVVEHDEDTIFASDYIVDIGPGAGIHGGQVVAEGWLSDLLEAKKNTSGSRTLAYLRNEVRIEVPEQRRSKDFGEIKVVGATIHNLQNVSVNVPLGKFVTITGVSGSGKSSFLYDILHSNLQGRLERKLRTAKTYHCASFDVEKVSRVVLIDQSPIGRTPRSNIATYTGAFTFIRDLFASTPDAKVRGWKPNRFSFNVKGGRCEACEGNGEIAVEMHFLPTVYVTCDVCQGKRFDTETLTVKYKGKNIYDVLQMSIEEAEAFFIDLPAVHDRLETLVNVGLSYVKLGQSATTLSGGEAQRVKISSELYRPHVEKTVYLLDEPTVGLHYDDVAKLLEVLNKLVNKGNSVIVIEHSMDIIKSSDYLIDFGPEGGTGGGQIVAKGTPEEVAKNPKSLTGKYLKKLL